MPTNTKFCRDCHWARDKYTSEKEWKCRSPENKLLNIKNEPWISEVTGEVISWVKTCKQARSSVTFCGPEARWFQTTKEVLVSMPRILESTNIRLSKIGLGDL